MIIIIMIIIIIIIIKCYSENSVNLGPIIVDIITKKKKKIDVPVGTDLAMPAFHTQVIL